MVDRYELEILRDAKGFPTQVDIKKGRQRLGVTYQNDGGKVAISGDSTLLELLNLIYPFQPAPNLVIPQPLQVTNVQGGKIILFDDFETLLKWSEFGATVAVDNAQAYQGNQSLKISAAAGAVSTALRYVPLSKEVTFTCVWGIDDWTKTQAIAFYMSLQRANHSDSAYIQFLVANKVWQYQGPTGAFVNIPDGTQATLYETLDAIGKQWNLIKFTVDFPNAKIKKLQVNDLFWDNLNVPLYRTIAASEQRSYCGLRVDAAAGQNANGWFDDVLVTEE